METLIDARQFADFIGTSISYLSVLKKRHGDRFPPVRCKALRGRTYCNLYRQDEVEAYAAYLGKVPGGRIGKKRRKGAALNFNKMAVAFVSRSPIQEGQA